VSFPEALLHLAASYGFEGLPTAMVEENKEVVRRYHDIYNSGQLDGDVLSSDWSPQAWVEGVPSIEGAKELHRMT
jgi:hypothetical protein